MNAKGKGYVKPARLKHYWVRLELGLSMSSLQCGVAEDRDWETPRDASNSDTCN